MSDLPRTSREVRLAAVPAGVPRPTDLTVAEVPVPAPGPGQVLVKNRFFHVFAPLRTLMGHGVAGAPLPALAPGDTLFGRAVGEIVAGDGARPGELVAHGRGWREYALLDAGEWEPLGDALPDPVAHLAQARTAYEALTDAARVRPGDVVFVSGGAGSLGSMAGQLARALGAGRVVGSTGSAAKAERMVAELGYDAAIVRGARPLADQLAEAAPDGIDVLVDNVGGEDLRAAVAVARTGARFALVGALSGQLSADGDGTTAPVELDSFQLILKRVTMVGFSNPARPAVDAEWLDRFGGWLRTGEVVFPHVRVAGIENAPQALYDAMTGRHLGTVVVALED
jgi:NADPH-dependent curcumin reductase CurA